jgi:hypothetical protein
MEISYSRASSYAKCPQSHYWGYIRRITTKKPVRPLQFGTDFHKLLELRTDKKALVQAVKDIREMYNDLPEESQAELGGNYIDDLKEIFSDYRALYADDAKPDETEHKFAIPLGKYRGEPVEFVGVIDEIYRPEGLVILGEHKTFSVAPDLSTLIMNQQTALYAKAHELEFGVKPGKILWDYIKSRPAAEPVWLEKSKRFSEAATKSITPMSWLRACARRGISPEEADNKAAQYETNITNFFFRHNLDINPNIVDSVWDDFKDLAKEIVVKGETNQRKNLTRDCSWCKYKPLCYAEFTGADIDYIVDKDYQPKQNKEEIDNAETE